jgi:hypothetical protein
MIILSLLGLVTAIAASICASKEVGIGLFINSETMGIFWLAVALSGMFLFLFTFRISGLEEHIKELEELEDRIKELEKHK